MVQLDQMKVFCLDPIRTLESRIGPRTSQPDEFERNYDFLISACNELRRARSIILLLYLHASYFDANKFNELRLSGVDFESSRRSWDQLHFYLAEAIPDCYFNFSEALRLLSESDRRFLPITGELAQALPKLNAIRHAIAHRVELAASPEKSSLSAPRRKSKWLEKGRNSSFFALSVLDGTTLQLTRKGEFLEMDIGIAGYNKLHGVWIRLLDLAGQLKQT